MPALDLSKRQTKQIKQIIRIAVKDFKVFPKSHFNAANPVRLAWVEKKSVIKSVQEVLL
jgi:hypothetical protein